jgi:hypothetical protein
MYFSCFKIKAASEDALRRLYAWMEKSPREIIKDVSLNKAEHVSRENGHWKGSSLFIISDGEWTVFRDLTDYFSLIPPNEWLEYAEENALIMVNCDEDAKKAELIAAEDGKIIRDFFAAENLPERIQNSGKLPFENETPVTEWRDMPGIIDKYFFLSPEKTGDVIIF